MLSSYDADGLRSEKTGSTGNRFFAYDGADPVIETSNNSSVTAVNTFGPAGLVSRYNTGNGVSTFYTPDERGNVAQRLTSTGAVASPDLYNAYGKKLAGGGASGDPYGFGGMAGYDPCRMALFFPLSLRHCFFAASHFNACRLLAANFL